MMNHRFRTNEAPGRRKGATLCVAAIVLLGIATWDSAQAQCNSTATGSVVVGTTNAAILNAVSKSGVSKYFGCHSWRNQYDGYGISGPGLGVRW